jgi:hypothetical protein
MDNDKSYSVSQANKFRTIIRSCFENGINEILENKSLLNMNNGLVEPEFEALNNFIKSYKSLTKLDFNKRKKLLDHNEDVTNYRVIWDLSKLLTLKKENEIAILLPDEHAIVVFDNYQDLIVFAREFNSDFNVQYNPDRDLEESDNDSEDDEIFIKKYQIVINNEPQKIIFGYEETDKENYEILKEIILDKYNVEPVKVYNEYYKTYQLIIGSNIKNYNEHNNHLWDIRDQLNKINPKLKEKIFAFSPNLDKQTNIRYIISQFAPDLNKTEDKLLNNEIFEKLASSNINLSTVNQTYGPIININIIANITNTNCNNTTNITNNNNNINTINNINKLRKKNINVEKETKLWVKNNNPHDIKKLDYYNLYISYMKENFDDKNKPKNMNQLGSIIKNMGFKDKKTNKGYKWIDENFKDEDNSE